MFCSFSTKFCVYLSSLLLALIFTVEIDGLELPQQLKKYENEIMLDTLPKPDIAGKPINIEIELKLSQIHELNLAKQYLSSSMFIGLKWNDSRLVYTPQNRKANNSVPLKISPSLIWVPDITLGSSTSMSNLLLKECLTKKVQGSQEQGSRHFKIFKERK